MTKLPKAFQQHGSNIEAIGKIIVMPFHKLTYSNQKIISPCNLLKSNLISTIRGLLTLMNQIKLDKS